MVKLLKFLCILSGVCVVFIIGYLGMKSFTNTEDSKVELSKSAEESVEKIGERLSETNNTAVDLAKNNMDAAGTVIKNETKKILNNGRSQAKDLKSRFEDAVKNMNEIKDSSEAEGNGHSSLAKNDDKKQRDGDDAVTQNSDNWQKLDSAQAILMDTAKLLR